ncbi:LPXTG cell wall anchor domain-containing protein [Agrococcus jejuensis]|uniref:LPXTG cell wall anchor domain-containing protein n=1 Tax=Agrococcus jejuensis TaxID=399736 RepID=UPI000B8A0C1F|nr:LPXTG cell wall anchor domain-containing protein [Agrococcus jejuensis]
MSLALAAAAALVAAPSAFAVEQPFAVQSPANGSMVDSTTPTFSGVGTTGNTVTLSYSGQNLGGYVAGSTVVGDAGTWSTPTSFASANPGETETRVRAVETTPGGVETDTYFITITFPTAPVPAANAFTLESPVEGETRADFLNIVHFVGTGDAGNTITVRYFDGRGGLATAGTGQVDQGGRFDVFATFRDLPAGQTFANTFTQQTNPAGEPVAAEIGRTFNFAVAPVEASPFTVTSPESGEMVDSITPAFTGTGAPGDTVTLRYSGQQLGSYLAGQTTVEDDGTWTVPTTDFSNASFGETEIRVVAAATDANGVERPGARFVDIVLPEAPAMEIDFTLATPEEGTTIANPRAGVAYVGTGEPGNTIVVEYFDGRGGLAVAGTAIVGDDGAFEVTAIFDGLPEGQLFANTFTQQEDADGERVAQEIARTIFFEVAPVVTPLAAPTLDEPVVDGATVTFSGTGIAGATVEVAIASAQAPTGDVATAALAAPTVVTATVAEDGTWTTSADFEAGDYVASATQFTGDAADRSAPSEGQGFTVAAVAVPPTMPPASPAPTTPPAAGGAGGGSLPVTGGEVTGSLLAAMLLLAAGAVTLVVRRQRVLAQR